MLAALLWLAAPLLTHAQSAASPWTAASVPSPTQYAGTSVVRATATDASGNVFVTGFYTGQVAFGTVLLPNAVSNDIFVAKYVPATATWAWVQTAGGIAGDQGNGLVVSGSSVYVTGFIAATYNDGYTVRFGGSGSTPGTVKQYGASSTGNADLFVAKYTDNGGSATFNWCQVGGGTSTDQGQAVAVSGSTVYVTGFISNSNAAGNANGVLFGGTGTTLAASPQLGASATAGQDVVVASYTDNGATGTFNWSQVGGGTGTDQGLGIAANGNAVYVTGFITNNLLNTTAVLFGGSGTVPGTAAQYGAAGTTAAATSQDLLLARYTDAGPTAALAWAQVGGGTGADQGTAVAATATGVYVTGYYSNNQADASLVRLGGSGATAGTTVLKGASTSNGQDLLLARYTDNLTAAALAWTQVGGGTSTDQGQAVAVSGTNVYVTGNYFNSSLDNLSVRFGGDGTTTTGSTTLPGQVSGSSTNVLVARYTDAGALGWVLGSGTLGSGYGQGLAVSGSSVYVGGYLSSSSRFAFGTASVAPLAGTYANRLLLGQVADGGGSGSWQALASTGIGGVSQARGVAADASGNLFVAGSFSGTVVVGGTTLVSAGGTDLYVAKYVPGTDTWAWAQSGGGITDDQATGVAVRGSSVYVAGSFVNSNTNVNGVGLGGTSPATSTATVQGATAAASTDLLLAKYTDAGPTGTLTWTQVAGGSQPDQANGVAVGGTNLVYVTGSISNTATDGYSVRFGGDGTTAGTVAQAGASSAYSQDLVLARYTDNGATATFNWSQVAGGSGADQGLGVAVSGTSVYVAGSITNNAADGSSVRLGGTGTTAGTAVQAGAATGTASQDLLLARYTDNGAANTATFNWSQVGGGTGADVGTAVAVNGSNVYVTGGISNTLSNTQAVVFTGGSGATASTSPQYGASTSSSNPDLVLAKYTDAGGGTFGWSQVGGGIYSDQGQAVAVNGPSVYVAGYIQNADANYASTVFGGTGTRPGTLTVKGVSFTNTQDFTILRYTDFGTASALRLVKVGGGLGNDVAYGLALGGGTVYAAGLVRASATFGSFAIANPLNSTTTLVTSLVDNEPLPVELTQFTATATGPSAVRLAWATASEKNSAVFEVERSADGRAFVAIGAVAAAGSSSRARGYELLDSKLPAGAATLYYRLRQVDADGSFSYSPVRTVGLTGAAAGLSLYPNPAHGGAATLTGALPGTTVTVSDALGRPVATATADATGTAALALPAGTPAGVYVVRAGAKAVKLTVE